LTKGLTVAVVGC